MRESQRYWNRDVCRSLTEWQRSSETAQTIWFSETKTELQVGVPFQVSDLSKFLSKILAN